MKFVIDIEKCIDCGGCWVACKDTNQVPEVIERIRIIKVDVGVPGERNIPVPCMHCNLPACEKVCPADAISKRSDGIVLVDKNKCIGCRYCRMVCPFGAPQFKEEGAKMDKCTYCVERIDDGLRPACGSFCATGAVFVGKSESDIDAEATRVGASKLAAVTDPDVYLKGKI
ncbi:MAG: 4Fe-4S dicluster domain-containing protein [Halobacteriota archaeon]|nr:4Fe-4S dicluster domain-containing protein [Halobacteriota archaeon]